MHLLNRYSIIENKNIITDKCIIPTAYSATRRINMHFEIRTVIYNYKNRVMLNSIQEL